jgi:uncharacterized protein
MRMVGGTACAGARRPLAVRATLAFVLLLASAFAFAQQLAAIPPLDSPVVDTTGTLDAGSRQQLEQQALALQQRKGSQLQILMVASTAPETIEQYTQRVFDAWKLGRKGIDDGVLLVVAKDDRKVRIQPGYGLEGAIPDITAGRIIREYLAPKFRQDDYAGGLRDASAQLVRLIEGESLPEPMTRQGEGVSGGNWVFALFAAFFVAQIARGMLRRLPAGTRGLLGGAASGAVAWMLSSLLLVGGLGAAIGFVVGLISGGGGGRYARDSGWGGFGSGPWIGGGSSGGDFGGGWSGGGGMSGGGGASGSW